MGTDETLPALAGPLYRFACRLTGNEADARDAVQETLAAVLEKRAAFRGPPEKFRSWVFRIAYRKAVDALRSRRRTVELTGARRMGGPWAWTSCCGNGCVITHRGSGKSRDARPDGRDAAAQRARPARPVLPAG